MKYGNTSRTLSLIFHSIILVAFGVLGFYFGIFVTPLYWTNNAAAFNNAVIYAYNFDLELSVLGLSLFAISVYGLIKAVKAILDPNDDEQIVRSFIAFIVEGYIGAIFCLANAAIYFDLLSFGSIPFIVVMGLLLGIILLIAVNIPMVKIFDGRDSTPLLAGMSFGGAVYFGFNALEIVVSLLGALIASKNGYTISFYSSIMTFLGSCFLALAIVTALTAVAGVIIGKKKSEKSLFVGGYLDSAAIMLVGLTVLANGVFDYYYRDSNSVHFESKTLEYTGIAYPVCAMVFGSLVVLAGIAFLVIAARDAKKPAQIAK